MPRCPSCENELHETDYFGKRHHSEHYWIYPHSWIDRAGGIYKCKNEECEQFEETCYSYDDREDDLHYGHPC